MSFTVTDAFVQQFSGNVWYLAQQMESRFRGKVLEDQITGESAYMEQVAPSAAQKITSRHSDTPIMNTQHLRRRLAPYDYGWGDLVDNLDKQKLLIDPASTYARTGAMAMVRGEDDEIIQAFFGTAYTGHSGGTVLTWPNGNSESSPTQPGGTVVAVNDWTYGNGTGNSGLTISKLVSASVALDAAEGDDGEERFCGIKALQKGNLLATTEATLKEYGVAKDDLAPLRDGKIALIMGFQLIHSERLQANVSSQTRVPAWRKSAMGLGINKDISARMAERPDKRFSLQVYLDMSIGATRLEEAKLVELVCA
jgi:hypothetical protein